MQRRLPPLLPFFPPFQRLLFFLSSFPSFFPFPSLRANKQRTMSKDERPRASFFPLFSFFWRHLFSLFLSTAKGRDHRKGGRTRVPAIPLLSPFSFPPLFSPSSSRSTTIFSRGKSANGWQDAFFPPLAKTLLSFLFLPPPFFTGSCCLFPLFPPFPAKILPPLLPFPLSGFSRQAKCKREKKVETGADHPFPFPFPHLCIELPSFLPTPPPVSLRRDMNGRSRRGPPFFSFPPSYSSPPLLPSFLSHMYASEPRIAQARLCWRPPPFPPL